MVKRKGKSNRSVKAKNKGRSRSKAASKFSYKQRSADAVKASMRKRDNDFFLADGIETYQPKDGENNVRILPPHPDEEYASESFGMKVQIHYGIGADNGSYICPNAYNGDPCPIDEERARVNREDEDEEYARELKATTRVLCYVIDRDTDSGPLVWSMPQTVYREIAKRSIDKRTGEVIPLDHPEEGYDVSFEKTGKNLNTKYTAVDIEREPSPVDNDAAIQFVLDNPLSAVVVVYDYDHIAEVFGGAAADEEEEEGDEEEEEGDEEEEEGDEEEEEGDEEEIEMPESWAAIKGMDSDELVECLLEVMDADDIETGTTQMRKQLARCLDIKVPKKSDTKGKPAKKKKSAKSLAKKARRRK